MEKLKCLVVDDEELARALLESYIAKLHFLELVGSAEGPVDAMNLMRETKVDILFLDIQMPEIKGTDFAKMIPPETRVIFTTAYSEYALDGYELNALDYLLKPITFERFLVAVNKIQSKNESLDPENTLTIKSGYDLYKVKYEDILYIKSDSEYVVYFTTDRKILSNQSLASLDKILPDDQFMRVHRSYIINRKKVTGLKGKELLIDTNEIPVSAQYFEKVKGELFGM